MNDIIKNAVDVVFGCPVFVNDSHSDELEQIQKELEKIIPLLVPNLSDSSNYPWDKGKNGNKS